MFLEPPDIAVEIVWPQQTISPVLLGAKLHDVETNPIAMDPDCLEPAIKSATLHSADVSTLVCTYQNVAGTAQPRRLDLSER